MPRGDRTGPRGAGPRTGRGLGYCGGYETSDFANPTFGWGRGRGGGFGWRHRFFATGLPGRRYPRYTPPTKEETLSDLKAEADWLKDQLENIHKHIDELEK
jgi:hypothetical protein